MRKLDMRGRPGGQSLVEFALVLPIIVLLLFGVLDLGRGVFVYNTLSEAARQANRLAIVDQDPARIRAEAVAYAPAVGLATSGVDVCFKAPGTSQRNCLNTTDACSPAQIGCLAIVTTRITFTAVTPVLGALAPPIRISSTSIGPIEHVCPTSLKPNCP